MISYRADSPGLTTPFGPSSRTDRPGTSTCVRPSVFSRIPLSAVTTVVPAASPACCALRRNSTIFRCPGRSVPNSHCHWLSSGRVRFTPVVTACTCAVAVSVSTSFTFSAGTLPVFSTSTRTVNGSSFTDCFGAVRVTFRPGRAIRVVVASPCSKRT